MRGRLVVLLASLMFAPGLALAAAKPAAPANPAVAPSPTVSKLARWAPAAGDSLGLPFVIIDKAAAEVFVFDADGKLLGAAPALLGLARGDESTPGIGDRELSDIAPEDRTTPAGRFLAAYGPGPGNEKVFWVDYGTAISMHPVITTKPKERRPQRLRSPTVDDNRITFGCINVPKAFYDRVVHKTFAASRGVVYILPEERSLADVFPTFGYQLAVQQTADARP